MDALRSAAGAAGHRHLSCRALYPAVAKRNQGHPPDQQPAHRGDEPAHPGVAIYQGNGRENRAGRGRRERERQPVRRACEDIRQRTLGRLRPLDAGLCPGDGH